MSIEAIGTAFFVVCLVFCVSLTLTLVVAYALSELLNPDYPVKRKDDL